MSPRKKVYGILVVSGLIVSLVVSVVIFSSKKDLSVEPSQAATIEITAIPTPTPSITVEPTLLQTRNQDVPLKVLGSVNNNESARQLSYLYTELTSKGIVSNVTSNSASILWITEAPQQTQLRFGISETQLSRRFSSTTATYIHEAKLEKLSANTLYYYTGHAPIVDTLTTPNTLLGNQLSSKKIFGTVKDGVGTCIVRVALSREGESSAYSTLLTTTGTWTFSLDKLRTSDYSAYYDINDTDTVEVDVLCVSSGKALFTGSKKFTLATLTTNSGEVKVYREN